MKTKRQLVKIQKYYRSKSASARSARLKSWSDGLGKWFPLALAVLILLVSGMFFIGFVRALLEIGVPSTVVANLCVIVSANLSYSSAFENWNQLDHSEQVEFMVSELFIYALQIFSFLL